MSSVLSSIERDSQFQAALIALARDDASDLSDSLARICGVAASTLDVARVSVWLFNNDHTELRCMRLFDRTRQVEESGAVLEVGRYPRYFEALEDARSIAADDARTHPATAEFGTDYLGAFGISSMLDVPIRREGRVVGVVCNEHVGLARQWRPEEQDFAASLADLTALVLETDHRRRYNQRLKLLRQTDRAILTARSVSEIAAAALARFREVVPCQRASVALFDEESGTARLEGVVCSGSTKLCAGAKLSLDVFGDAEALRQGKPYVVDNIEAIPATPSRRALEEDGIRSFVVVPLLAQGHLIGTLNFGSDRPAAFEPEHVEIAQEVADSLAVAIRDANLQEQVQRHTAELEQRVVERTAELQEANARLQQSEDRIRSLYNSTPVMMHSLDDQGRLLEVNDYWLKVLGYERDEVIGQPVVNFVPPEQRSYIVDVVMPRLARDGFVKDIDAQGVKKSGEIVELLVSSVVKRGADGRFLFSQTFMLDITEQRRALRENLYLQEALQSELRFEEIVGLSPAMQEVYKSIAVVAPTDSVVLILGETGTGKELIARAIHNTSRRKERAFVKLNCAAIPTGLLESELFGHEKGAFTGAIAQRIGRFEVAHNGTAFLDEIGEIPLELQPKLLRVLQEREFERLGSTRTMKTDARLVAATNRDLGAMVEDQQFRADLFYRLNVFPIRVPPLRERPEDIPLLVRHFAQQFARSSNKTISTVPSDVMAALERYHWPGNVRELQNVIERAVILSTGPALKVPLSDLKPRKTSEIAGATQSDTLQEAERKHILAALEGTNWVVGGPGGAAARLGMNRSTLQFRMRKLGIERPVH
jgi:formate hydrogenlyase transcriptional activator